MGELTRVSHSGGASAVVLVENNPMSILLHPTNSLLVQDWRGDGAFDRELARVTAILDAILLERNGEAGDYAGRLAEVTPGFPAFQQELEYLLSRVRSEPPSGKSHDVAIIELW